jgi:hypothetical protein
MIRFFSLGSAIALSTATALAQLPTVVVPAAAENVQIGSTVNIWRAGLSRTQAIYDSTNFSPQAPNVPLVISDVEFRLANGEMTNIVTYPSVEIYLQYSANDYLTPSTTFANNRTIAPGTLPNYAGSVTTLPVAGTAPNDYFINIPLQTPFTYDPTIGQDLLMEIVILTNPAPLTGNNISSGSNVVNHKANSIRVTGTTSPTALTGSQSAFPPVARFTYLPVTDPGFNVSLGQGCYTRARSYYEVFPFLSNDVSGNTVSMTINSNGGYDVSMAPGGTVTLPTTAGLALGDDVVSSAINLPWTFEYPGGSTNTVYVDSNGCLLLGASGPSVNGGTAPELLNAVTPRLAAAFCDLLPDGATNVANVLAEVDPGNPNVYLFTWLNVATFQTGGAPPTGLTSTFQIALVNNGTNDVVQYRYQSLKNDSTSDAGACVVGFSLGGGAIDLGASDISAGPISTWADTLPVTLNGLTRPVVNLPWNLRVTNVPPTCPFVLTIFGLTDLGVDDAFFIGLPGCGLRSDLILTDVVFPAGSIANYGIVMANDPTLNGVIFYTTVAAFTNPPQNDLGVLTSNGIAGHIGLN